MSRGVKKLMQEKFPNMSKFEDISELLMKWGFCFFFLFFSTYIFLNSVFDRQRVKPPVVSYFLLLEAQTFRKVKRNRTGTTTSPSCRRFTLGEATWPPNRALSVLRRWERNKSKWSTTTIVTEAWSISSITLSDWTTHESTAYKNPRRHGRRKRSLSFHQ